MKKLVFMFVAMAAISFASCTDNAKSGAANDSDSVAATEVMDSAATDSAALDSAAAPVDSAAAATVDSAAAPADSAAM